MLLWHKIQTIISDLDGHIPILRLATMYDIINMPVTGSFSVISTVSL